MKDEKHNIWDVWIKMISSILTLVALIIGILQYQKNNERDFRKEFYANQFRYYENISNLASELALTPIDSIETKSFKGLKFEFEKNYYGAFNLIQDEAVEKSIINFYLGLKKFEKYDEEHDNSRMQNLSLDITQNCRKSLLKTWELENYQEFILKTDSL